MPEVIILGGGITGLATAYASGHPVCEARGAPGGICASYYVRRDDSSQTGAAQRLDVRPEEPAYRFEIGGGHWIFGGDPAAKRFMRRLVPMNRYQRQSAVYLPERDLRIPYPLQNHLGYFPDAFAARALTDVLEAPDEPRETMDEWLRASFGNTLCKEFFEPFHDLYTAGLHSRIAPQDPYKSPLDVDDVVEGAFGQADEVGYNVEYLYPEGGLDTLMRRLAGLCDVRYDKRAVEVDVDARTVAFADGSTESYETLVSTLPLNRMIEMTGLSTDGRTDPHTSVLVLNIGGIRGADCPDDHWIYVPQSEAGFHRVGIYSNVDADFVPEQDESRASFYVERAFQGGTRPTDAQVEDYANTVVEELKAWGYLDEAEIVDPTWIDVAYTWSWPGSSWKQEALDMLHEHDVLMVGRYARWVFQGIADSLRDGLFVGSTLRTEDL
jgi:protoporphyrinogen oxidase